MPKSTPLLENHRQHQAKIVEFAGFLMPLQYTGVELPEELLALLRYGRAGDNRRLKQAGFRYKFTSAGAVESFAEAARLRRTVGATRPDYTYERDVENFFRHSPAVVRET
jgi:UDP-glucose 4-epimerase